MYSSLASILDMFIFPVFFAFFVSTYSFLFEKKNAKSLGNASQNERGPFCIGICSIL